MQISPEALREIKAALEDASYRIRHECLLIDSDPDDNKYYNANRKAIALINEILKENELCEEKQ